HFKFPERRFLWRKECAHRDDHGLFQSETAGKDGVGHRISKNYPCRKRWKVYPQFGGILLELRVLLEIIMKTQHKLVVSRPVCRRDSYQTSKASDNLTECTRRRGVALDDSSQACIH